MIRYPVTKKKLESLISATKADWLTRPALRTEDFRKQGYYSEKKGMWSEVKAVYMRLQGNGKCAYCEREMESVALGKVEQDVEHFRPKGRVKAWKAPKALTDAGVVFTDAPAPGKGYYLLPYHIFNYAAACKPCNSTLKKDYFPIAGTYDLDAEDPTQLANEKAYLIYPIGSWDDNPEDLDRVSRSFPATGGPHWVQTPSRSGYHRFLRARRRREAQESLPRSHAHHHGTLYAASRKRRLAVWQRGPPQKRPSTDI